MMHMTFYWSKEVTLLVNSWRTSMWLSYSATLIACFLFSVFYQFLEHRRVTHLSKSSSSSSSTVKTPLLGLKSSSNFSFTNAVSAALFGLNAAIGYLLMLAVMSFNGGVFVSVVTGLGTGYFVFRCDDGEESRSSSSVENSCAACS